MVTQYFLIALAIIYFIAISIVSIQYFRISDFGAKRGRHIISLLVSIGSGATIFCLITRPPPAFELQLIAIALYIYALFIFVWTWQSNRSKSFDFAFSNKQPDFISQNGPYRWIRHPFYSSYCFSWMASSIATQNVLVILLSAILISAYVIAAKKEEKIFISSDLSNEYKAYTRRAGMLFPKIPL